MAIPMTGVEILYPVVPKQQANTVLVPKDNEDYGAAQKSSSAFVRKTSSMRWRVDRTAIAALLDHLHTNAAAEMQLATPAYTPFGVNSQNNNVRLLSHGAPSREGRGLTYLLDLTFLFISVIP